MQGRQEGLLQAEGSSLKAVGGPGIEVTCHGSNCAACIPVVTKWKVRCVCEDNPKQPDYQCDMTSKVVITLWQYDNESLVYEGVERGVLNVNESNIGTIRSGVITTSWNSNVGESYKSNEVLYSIVFKATRSGNISKMISITSDVTRAEAYDNLDQVKEVKLGVRTDKGIVET